MKGKDMNKVKVVAGVAPEVTCRVIEVVEEARISATVRHLKVIRMKKQNIKRKYRYRNFVRLVF